MEKFDNDQEKLQELAESNAETIPEYLGSSLDQRLDQSVITPERREEINSKDASKLESLRQKLGIAKSWVKERVGSFIEGSIFKTNILYRPDRLYRCIGRKGYEEFLDTGEVGSKNKKKYFDVSFNLGEPANRYLTADPSYVLEATPEAANFTEKINPYSFKGEPMKDIPYRSCDPGEITKNSPIRIFEMGEERGKYKVVFDNIGDQALKEDLTSSSTSSAV